MGDRVTNDDRVAAYLAANASTRLTPAQRRRIRKHDRRALSPLAGVVRASRLRKALERARRREVQAQAAHVVGLVRTLRSNR